MDGPLPPPTTDSKRKTDDNSKDDSDGNDEADSPIATWTYCKHCAKVVTPLVYISENTWKLSFGKFLEIFFYNRDAVMNSSEYNCSCPMQTGTMLYFGCGKLAARFSCKCRTMLSDNCCESHLTCLSAFNRRTS